MNDEQESVYKKVISCNDNFFITGGAGTGKSYLLGVLVKHFTEEYGVGCVGVTAMTGLAASSINGRTLHSWAGLGINGTKKLNSFTKKKWDSCRVLIIDEVSMMSMDYFEDIFYCLKKVRVIMFGDFFQLPPIDSKMIFKSKCWDMLKLNCIILKTVVRQDNIEFINILDNIRWGRITDSDIEWLKNNTSSDKGDDYTSIHPINRSVDRDNTKRLKELNVEEVKLSALDTITLKSKNDSNNKKYNDILSSSIEKTIPKDIIVKIGSRVMLTKNSMDNSSLVNGMIGVLRIIQKETLVIQFEKTGDCETIKREDFVESLGGVTITRKQYPIKLAWSLTIHKSQGLTMKYMKLSIGDSFEDGQCYVGISRASNPECLILSDIDSIKKKNRVSKDVIKFYNSLFTSS